MDNEEFIKLVARVLSGEADLTEVGKLNQSLKRDPELAGKFGLLEQFWKEEKKGDPPCGEMLDRVWTKIRQSNKRNGQV